MNRDIKENKNIISIAKNIIHYANKIKRVYWTNEEIERFFGKRSAIEIARNKTTCFMNPCLDLNLISAGVMFEEGIPYTFVIEEHLPTKDFNFNRLHFVLELEHEKNKYYLNYKKANEVYLSGGKYNGREDLLCAQIIRIPGEKIHPEKTLYENLGYTCLDDLIKDKFQGYSLESNISRLKRDNSEENYELYKSKYGEDLQLILKPRNQL